MQGYIIKIKDKYFAWSGIEAAPTTYAMTEAELYQYVKEECEDDLKTLPLKLKRVEAKGTSSLLHKSLESQLEKNRAGLNESCIGIDEIYERYNTPPPCTE